LKNIVVIFPVFNKLLFTKKAVKSILAQDLPEGVKLSLIIIDNASDDKSTAPYLEELNSTYDNVFFLRNDENKGFAIACNQGIDYALSVLSMDADVIITNNDVEFLENCVINLYKSAYQDTETGIVGGKLLFPDGTIQHAGAFLNVGGWGQHIGAGADSKDLLVCNKRVEMEYVTGALFYIKNELLKQLPGFDESFTPAYFEEVDYCYEARRRGYSTFYEPTATAIHYENVTGVEIYKNTENLKKTVSDTNQITFYKKHLNDEYTSLNPYKLLMTCKIYGQWSFTIVMKNLAKGLKRAGVDVSIAPEEYHDLQPVPDWEIKEMIQKPNDYWNRDILHSCEGDHAYLMPPSRKNGKRILHTTGESTLLHKGWKDQANNVDLVLTNSTFFENVLKDNGVKTEIKIIPNSLDTTLFHPNITPYPTQNLRKFNFISVFSYGDRKGPEILVEAFSREFKSDEDVALYIQSPGIQYILQQKGKSVQQWIDETSHYEFHAPILVSPHHVHENILPNILKNFQCNVLSTRGEGFGNSIVECGALGIPSIVTNWSGVTDFVNTNTGWLIDCDLVDIPLQFLPYFKNYIGGRWADPNIEHLMELMRWAYDHPEEVKRKGAVAALKATQYDIGIVGQQLKQIIWD
jgi:GT2 family glycosyltransferase